MFGAQIVQILKDEFGPLGFKICEEIKAARPLFALESNKKAREVLGIDFISGKDSIIAMGRSLIDLGVVKSPQ